MKKFLIFLILLLISTTLCFAEFKFFPYTKSDTDDLLDQKVSTSIITFGAWKVDTSDGNHIEFFDFLGLGFPAWALYTDYGGNIDYCFFNDGNQINMGVELNSGQYKGTMEFSTTAIVTSTLMRPHATPTSDDIGSAAYPYGTLHISSVFLHTTELYPLEGGEKIGDVILQMQDSLEQNDKSLLPSAMYVPAGADEISTAIYLTAQIPENTNRITFEIIESYPKKDIINKKGQKIGEIPPLSKVKITAKSESAQNFIKMQSAIIMHQADVENRLRILEAE